MQIYAFKLTLNSVVIFIQDRRGFRHLPFHSTDYRVYLSGVRGRRRRWTCFLTFIIVVQLLVIYYLLTQTSLFTELESAIKHPDHTIDISNVLPNFYGNDKN